ncbi:MAG: hypothetical protein Unbinned8622contig1003_3 [Prokaryotic dsDNA virus sp.]|mgnify:CR=1 FL=1|nr:MAG: hypothetical protein Unbinned8622contig1003_3 [Prokaryotic dsDNA virus sp.]|tara:strand:- start:5500 stop:5940 length:441 start_codon:yes stop_codon:yes gene_type:complete
MDLGEPMVFPSIVIPEPIQLPAPIIEIPQAEVPSYTPLVAPPSDLRPPPGVDTPKKQKKAATEPVKPPVAPITLPPIPPEVVQVQIPNTDISIPVPETSILVTAATTATVSVAATLTATALFKRLVSLMRPVIKKILTTNQSHAEN